MSDIEQDIQAKGLTAPRITPADIEAEIASEHYFTAQDGRNGAMYAGVYAGREAAQRLHRPRRVRLREPGELRRGDRPEDRARERHRENVAAPGLPAAHPPA